MDASAQRPLLQSDTATLNGITIRLYGGIVDISNYLEKGLFRVFPEKEAFEKSSKYI